MENYGNLTVKVLGMFHAFIRWKDRVYRQLFYVTDCDKIPELVVKGCLLHSGCSQTLLHSGEGTKCTMTIWRQKPSLHQKMKGRWQETVQQFQETVNFTESAERLPIDEAGTFFMCTLMFLLE